MIFHPPAYDYPEVLVSLSTNMTDSTVLTNSGGPVSYPLIVVLIFTAAVLGAATFGPVS